MGRTRVFYGHEGVVPPTGLRPRSAAAPAPEDYTDTERVAYAAAGIEIQDDGTLTEGGESAEAEETETIDLPDASWKVSAIDKFAQDHGIKFADGDKKPAKLATIDAWAAGLDDNAEGE